MENQAVFLALIRETYPELVIRKASEVVERQNNDLLIVNDQYLFRFPRHLEPAQQLQIECAILNGIRGHITSVEVPVPIYTKFASTVGEAFVGYEMISGEVGTLKDMAT